MHNTYRYISELSARRTNLHNVPLPGYFYFLFIYTRETRVAKNARLIVVHPRINYDFI